MKMSGRPFSRREASLQSWLAAVAVRLWLLPAEAVAAPVMMSAVRITAIRDRRSVR
jgi:hypothetical protein